MIYVPGGGGGGHEQHSNCTRRARVHPQPLSLIKRAEDGDDDDDDFVARGILYNGRNVGQRAGRPGRGGGTSAAAAAAGGPCTHRGAVGRPSICIRRPAPGEMPGKSHLDPFPARMIWTKERQHPKAPAAGSPSSQRPAAERAHGRAARYPRPPSQPALPSPGEGPRGNEFCTHVRSYQSDCGCGFPS